MIEKINKKENVYGIEFRSIEEFLEYIQNTELNKAITCNGSVENDKEFTGTYSFEQAEHLLKDGWSFMAEKLSKQLKSKEIKVGNSTRAKSVYDVCGYQASVPRYLQGIPASMVNRKNVPEKQKVVTINKCINYSSAVSTRMIEEESIKALQIVKKLEAQGMRINLNVVWYISENSYDRGRINFVKVRVKNANERLNISKLAFPLVHPSMLRRLFFRFIEVYPHVKSSIDYTYGYPVSQSRTMRENKGEYVLPAIFHKEVESVSDLEEFRAR